MVKEMKNLLEKKLFFRMDEVKVELMLLLALWWLSNRGLESKNDKDGLDDDDDDLDSL
jgi:hypothetical protein